MQHKCFRHMDNLLSGYNNYIDAYAAFLQSGYIPPCLEDDMYRLFQLSQSTKDDTEDTEVSLHTCYILCNTCIFHTLCCICHAHACIAFLSPVTGARG